MRRKNRTGRNLSLDSLRLRAIHSTTAPPSARTPFECVFSRNTLSEMVRQNREVIATRGGLRYVDRSDTKTFEGGKSPPVCPA